MAAYATLDYLPDLSLATRNAAAALVFTPYGGTSSRFDNEAVYFGSSSLEELLSVRSIYLREGATYDFGSASYFDPYYIRLYDSSGNAIAVNQADTDYGQDYLLGYVAPYSGKYYVDAGWDQGSVSRTVVFLALEDVDTIASQVLNGTSGPDTIGGTSGNGNDTLAGWVGNDRRMKNSLVIRDWEALASYVLEMRKKHKNQKLFVEFEVLARDWADRTKYENFIP